MQRTAAGIFSAAWLLSGGIALAEGLPTDGWTIHIDAKRHIAGDLEAIAHHYCKGGLPNDVIQCQLYDSDDSNARLVGVEVVIGPDAYASLSDEEKSLWHYHKEELGRVEPLLPDMTEEEAAEFAMSIEETYGKIFLVWDTSQNNIPIGQPQAYDIGDNAKGN